MRRVLHLINDVSLGWFFAALVTITVGFGFGYWVLANTGPGYLVFTYETDAHPGLLDSIYFSIVTLSSLGYGDIRPVGPARLLVGLEVMVGLAFFGLLVAKISSVKQDYILRRLYSEAEDEKLARFASDLEELRALYRTTSTMLVDGELDPGLTTTFRRDTPGATFFSRYRLLLSEVADFMLFEASNHALFGVVEDSRLEAVYDSIRGVLRRTTILWERDPDRAGELVLCGNAEELGHICDLSERLATLGLKRSGSADIREICSAIVDLVASTRRDILPKL